MGIEFELKYKADPQVLERLRAVFSGPEQQISMHTTYYDTPTGGFSARKWTLRRRMENDVSICTLKTPGDGFGRREWEVACGSIREAITELCKLGAPQEVLSLAAEGFLPICGARFTRIPKTVIYQGSVLELALDAGVLTGGDREMPLCEVEVELKEGSREACLTFAHSLAEEYGLQIEENSKFRRALALYKGESL